jgi:chemotaxis protein MotA
VAGISVVAASIAIAPGATLRGFIDYPSLMCVLGGATAAVLLSTPLRQFLNLFRVVKNVFLHRQEDFNAIIEQLVSLAEIARRDGLLALEARLEEVENWFVALGLQMAVDGTRPEVIEEVMRSEMDALATRHRNGKTIFDQFGKYGPAFGMLGTLIGLVIMLGNIKEPDAISSGMAVALITTLYGSILANVVCLPCADKLSSISKHELLAMEIALRGVMAIQSGDNPRVIERRLRTFVPPKLRPGFRKAA